MFYQRFLKLCASKNLKPNQVTKALGLSTATATNWKDGSIPRDITLERIADYFGVTVDYLLGKDAPASAEENDAKRELLNRIGQMDDDQLKQLSDYADYLIDKKK